MFYSVGEGVRGVKGVEDVADIKGIAPYSLEQRARGIKTLGAVERSTKNSRVLKELRRWYMLRSRRYLLVENAKAKNIPIASIASVAGC